MALSSNTDLKNTNRCNIYRYIYEKKMVSKQMIAERLNLSLPTVSQNLKYLEEAALIKKDGHQKSTGGRKANLISINPSAHIAIGLELLKDHFEIVACDLYGNIIDIEKMNVSFCNDDTYFHLVCNHVNSFIRRLSSGSSHVLGIGIVLQGLISSNGTFVSYGKILNCTGLTIDSFQRYLSYPCFMMHDAEAAASCELWWNPEISDAIFLHIRQTLSGSIIIDGDFLKWRELKSGIFEHMVLVPDGSPCYCGKNGCVEAYCSLNALLEENESIDIFFQKLRMRNTPVLNRWKVYLEYLATVIDNLHMLMDCDIILGGTLAKYLVAEDLDSLHYYVMSQSSFPSDRQFIRVTSQINQPVAIGGALHFIKQYLRTIWN